jgi:hypothetical protein
MLEIRLKISLLAALWGRVSLCMRFKASTKVENNRTILDRFLPQSLKKTQLNLLGKAGNLKPIIILKF